MLSFFKEKWLLHKNGTFKHLKNAKSKKKKCRQEPQSSNSTSRQWQWQWSLLKSSLAVSKPRPSLSQAGHEETWNDCEAQHYTGTSGGVQKCRLLPLPLQDLHRGTTCALVTHHKDYFHWAQTSISNHLRMAVPGLISLWVTVTNSMQ